MKLKAFSHFKAKVIAPCSLLLSIFKSTKKFEKPSRTPTFRLPKRRRIRPRIRTKTVRFRKPFSIKAFRFPRCHLKTKFRLRKSERNSRHKNQVQQTAKPVQKVRIAELMTVLFSLRKAKELDTESNNDQVMGDTRSVSVSEGGRVREPFPSPITPGYVNVRISDDSKKESSRSDDLEDVEDVCKRFENYLVEMIVDEGKVKDLMDVEELLYCWRNLKSPVFIDLVCGFYGELCKDLFAPSEETDSTLESSTSD